MNAALFMNLKGSWQTHCGCPRHKESEMADVFCSNGWRLQAKLNTWTSLSHPWRQTYTCDRCGNSPNTMWLHVLHISGRTFTCLCSRIDFTCVCMNSERFAEIDWNWDRVGWEICACMRSHGLQDWSVGILYKIMSVWLVQSKQEVNKAHNDDKDDDALRVCVNSVKLNVCQYLCRDDFSKMIVQFCLNTSLKKTLRDRKRGLKC